MEGIGSRSGRIRLGNKCSLGYHENTCCMVMVDKGFEITQYGLRHLPEVKLENKWSSHRQCKKFMDRWRRLWST